MIGDRLNRDGSVTRAADRPFMWATMTVSRRCGSHELRAGPLSPRGAVDLTCSRRGCPNRGRVVAVIHPDAG